MQFHGDETKREKPPGTEPLFQAMMEGKVIASITLMRGSMNRENPEHDFTINNVRATDYWQAAGMSFDKEKGEYVDVDYVMAEPKDFYINWVRSFQLD